MTPDLSFWGGRARVVCEDNKWDEEKRKKSKMVRRRGCRALKRRNNHP